MLLSMDICIDTEAKYGTNRVLSIDNNTTNT